jgi:GNAT superfamily N-acetyltransferase
MTVSVRPMRTEDIEGVGAVVRAADEAALREAGEEITPPTPEQEAQFNKGTQRFIDDDPQGAWVAVDGDTVVGMAEAIRRDWFWGLSMLFVHPDSQSHGVGRLLIDKTLAYAEGATVRMIMTSPDPRALRRYSLAGLDIHPAVEASGVVDRSAIPADLRGREGSDGDLDLIDDVDRGLLGRSRRNDVEFAMGGAGAVLDVIDDDKGRGFILLRKAHVTMLGATDEDTATQLLWRALARTGEEKASLYCMTAAQDWAVRVCLAARLKVVGAGPLFISGMDHPPGPWIPSGWYF